MLSSASNVRKAVDTQDILTLHRTLLKVLAQKSSITQTAERNFLCRLERAVSDFLVVKKDVGAFPK